MTDEELTERVNSLMDSAKNLLVRDGELETIALALLEGGGLVGLAASQFLTEEAHFRCLRTLVKKLGAQAVFLVAEAWFYGMGDHAGVDGECIVVCGRTRTRNILSVVPFFREEDGKVTFSEPWDSEEVWNPWLEGIFSETAH